MERGLYIAASGMMASMIRQDTIASNLANVNTNGFKGDRVVGEAFGDLFLSSVATGAPIGNLSLGTRVAGTVTDFSQGSLKPTTAPFDVALAGEGFFVIQTSEGRRYTRDGQFSVNSDGILTTLSGESVLGTDGQPIKIGSSNPVISPEGVVYEESGDQAGQLAVVKLDMDTATKLGGNKWTGTETGAVDTGRTSVRQGYLEASTVNSVKEMVEMVTTMRQYESMQRAVMSIDGTLDRSVNSLGSLQ